PIPIAKTVVSPIIFPALSVSLIRNSAIYLVAVNPRPNPANIENILTVDRTIPSSPYTVLPKILATTIDAIIIKPCDTRDPVRDQKAPFASRLATSESSIFFQKSCIADGRREYILLMI